MLKKVLFALLTLLTIKGYAQSSAGLWADSVLNTLTVDDKIYQMMILAVNLEEDDDEIRSRVRRQKIGGVLFPFTSPNRQVRLATELQSLAAVPLFIAMDAGQGLIGDSIFRFPNALTLGAVEDDSLLHQLGRAIGYQLHALGVNLNFAPDVMFNLSEDSVDHQAFGEQMESVAKKTLTMMQGMQREGVLACARYYPSGLTVTRIQRGIPTIRERPDSARAYVMRQLVAGGVTGIFPAPRDLPLFYRSKRLARKNTIPSATLSTAFTANSLRRQFHFDQGLLFASIPAAYASSREISSGDPEAMAFQAGNDILVAPEHAAAAVRKIKKLIKKDKNLAIQLDQHVRRILVAKYSVAPWRPPLTDNLVRRLNAPKLQILKQSLLENAITVVKNESRLLPILNLENKSVACINVGLSGEDFSKQIARYDGVDMFDASNDSLANKLNAYDVVIIGLFPHTAEDRFRLQALMSELSAAVVLCDFSVTRDSILLRESSAFVEAYTSDPVMLRAAPEVIFGAIPARGTLPVAFPHLAAGTGIRTDSLSRLGIALPEAVGVSSEGLEQIRSIAWEAIDSGATPGCSVMIARKGKIIFQESFGWHTYKDRIPVDESTIYDLASVTKVAATLQAFMFLYEKGYFDLDKKVSAYLPELKGTNKEDLTLVDVLTHQSGLLPFLPFWRRTMRDTTLLPAYYSHAKSDLYNLQVAKNLYTLSTMRDSLWQWVIDSPLQQRVPRKPYGYVYSDMGLYILYHLCIKYLNQPIEDFLDQNLYDPLGASHMGFLPLERFAEDQIAPTENDTTFRKKLLIGTVHDQGAALAGGVAGHAGLFGTVNDLTKLGQMLLQNGYYGGTRYYKPATVELFIAPPFRTSHRGLGWNKPVPSSWITATSTLASPSTFGHTGFTGTCIWVDPEFDLVYVFLSNRVNPIMTNNKLIELNIRSRIQDVIYESIFDYCRYPPGYY